MDEQADLFPSSPSRVSEIQGRGSKFQLGES
jgi:hypothetical protein